MGLLFTALLLGGADLPPPPLGRVALLLRALWAGVCLGTSTTQRREKKSARPQRGGSQAAPPAREGRKAAPLKGKKRDHHSNELNLTPVNLRSLSFLMFPIFLQKRERHHTTGKKKKSAPPRGRQGNSTPPKGGEGKAPKKRSELLPPFLLGGGASLRLLSMAFISSAFLWVARPFPFCGMK